MSSETDVSLKRMSHIPDKAVLDLGGNLVSASLIHAGVQVDAHARLLRDRTLLEIDVERARRRRRHVEKLDAVGARVQEVATRGAHRVVKLVPVQQNALAVS